MKNLQKSRKNMLQRMFKSEIKNKKQRISQKNCRSYNFVIRKIE
nr:MAG TPA: hypothetical protein [Caudoviricetes sp.]